MKVKDFLRDVADKGNIRDNDFEAALGASALAEVEIPDTIKDKFHESYLTRERAENDPIIIEKIGKGKSREIFGNVDSRVEALLEFVDDDTKEKIKKTFESYKKLELLKEGISEGLKKHQAKKGSEDVRKVEEEWAGKVKSINEAHLAEKAEMLKNFKQTSLNTALKLKIKDFKFGEAFDSIKDVLSNSIIEKLRLEQINGKPIELEQGEDGSIHVRQNVDGALRDVFDKDQNRVTVDSLLTKHVEPFIVKSNGNGGNNNPNNGNNGQNGKQKPKLGANPTLHEMRMAQAG